MIICPGCRSEQMNGTLFCADCGADLQNPAASTFDLPMQKVSNAPPPISSNLASLVPPAPRPARSSSSSSKGMPPARSMPAPEQPVKSSGGSSSSVVSRRATRHGFHIMVLNSGRVLDCPQQENVIIGRSDAITGDMPDIDLAPDNALELGVSRRHACITFRETQPLLTDLGSTNRTFLNRQVMMRGQPYEIKDGDEVRFGNVIVKVIYNPAG